MSPLPEDAAEHVRKMKSLEQGILAAVDQMLGRHAAPSGGPNVVPGAASEGRMTMAERARDPSTVARTGMSRLRRALTELEAIAEEQDRPSDRAAVLEAVAERTASHDGVRQIVRDATIEAARSARDREEDARAALGLTDRNDAANQPAGGSEAPSGRGAGSSQPPPADEAGAVAMANDATAGLRRTRAMMAEELEKGRRTLAAMAESRAQLKRTGDEYGGSQRAALGAGGKLLTTLERQAVVERIILWVGFACFLLAAAHVVLKRTPVLVRFHPLYYIRHAAAKRAKEAKEAVELAAKEAREAAGTVEGGRIKKMAAGTVAAAASMASSAVAAATEDAFEGLDLGKSDPEAVLARGGAYEEAVGMEAGVGQEGYRGAPEVEVGDYMKARNEGRVADEDHHHHQQQHRHLGEEF